MSGHADTIREALQGAMVGRWGRENALRSLDALLAENQRLEAERDLAEAYIPVVGWKAYAAAREALAGDTE